MSTPFIILILALMLWCYTVLIAYPLVESHEAEFSFKVKVILPIGLLNVFFIIRLILTGGALTLNDIVITMFVLFMYQIIMGVVFILIIIEEMLSRDKHVVHPQDTYRAVNVLIVVAASLYFEYKVCQTLIGS